MIKGVLFDFWGTLVENGTYSPLRQSYQILGARMPFSAFVVLFEQAYMTRKFEDHTSAFKEVFKAFRIDENPAVMEKLIGVWNKNKLLAKPYSETVEALEALKKKGIKLAIISNTPCFGASEVIEKFDMKKFFDFIALSYETGLLKTEKKMFAKVLKELKIDKSEALMVGDSIETDIEGAKLAEVKGILIDRRDRRDFPEKIKNLKEVLDLVK